MTFFGDLDDLWFSGLSSRELSNFLEDNIAETLGFSRISSESADDP